MAQFPFDFPLLYSFPQNIKGRHSNLCTHNTIWFLYSHANCVTGFPIRCLVWSINRTINIPKLIYRPYTYIHNKIYVQHSIGYIFLGPHINKKGATSISLYSSLAHTRGLYRVHVGTRLVVSQQSRRSFFFLSMYICVCGARVSLLHLLSFLNIK